jgi:hypothetical protein
MDDIVDSGLAIGTSLVVILCCIITLVSSCVCARRIIIPIHRERNDTEDNLIIP